jgi:hypothetical protein
MIPRDALSLHLVNTATASVVPAAAGNEVKPDDGRVISTRSQAATAAGL